MAYRFANAAGNFSAAGTWDEVANTPTLHSSTNITVTAGGITSASFTAPNITNAATGVAVYVPAIGTAGTITATLQESGVDVATSPAVNITSLVTGTWVYFRLSAAYTYTTTAANTYRWKLNTSGASGTTTVAADSGAANFAYLSTDDRNTAPSAGDLLWIISPNQGASMTVTADANTTFGGFTSTSVPSARALTNDLSLYNNGVLNWSTTASVTLTCRGAIHVGKEGYFQMGTVATPIPSSFTATLQINQDGTAANYGIRVDSTGRFILQGAQYSSTSLWHTDLSSGTGTAASPAIMSDSVDWNVNDRVVITPASDSATNYNETEVRYIITKNSATSYVWSSSLGGAETALTYARTYTARVVNITKNVVIQSDLSTTGWYFRNDATTSGYVDVDWARLLYPSGTTVSKPGFGVTSTSSTLGNVDYTLVEENTNYGISWWFGRPETTHTGIVAYNGNSVTNSGSIAVAASSHNKNLIDCYAIQQAKTGFQISGIYNVNFTRCRAYACNTSNVANHGGIRFINFGGGTYTDCEFHCNRSQGISLTGAFDTDFVDVLCGTKGTNTVDVFASESSGVYNKVHFENGNFGSSSLISGYTDMISSGSKSSEITFQKRDQTTNQHEWYTKFGSAVSTGSGLTDSTVRTSGSLALRLAPEDSTTGFYWDFLVLAKANAAVTCFGFIKKNTLFGTDDIDAELYLPGSTPGVDTPDDSYSMPDNTDWNPFFLGANHTGSVPLFATVRIVAKTTTAGAYCYLDDFYNGTNDIIDFDTWYRGKPAPILYPELGDPESVWAVLTSTQTTSGTMGKKHVDNLTRNQFIALD